jgi:cytochrome c-type biogenesis protein CcmH
MMRSKYLNAALLAIFAVLLLTSATSADTPEPGYPSDDDVNQVARQLYCPVCENIPLDVCPTTACSQWRDLIGEKLADGWSEAQIKQYFVDQYGDRVLSEPPRRGLHWLVYILPPVFFLAGIYVVFRVLRSMRTPTSESAEENTTSPAENAALTDDDDPYIRRMEEELKRRD